MPAFNNLSSLVVFLIKAASLNPAGNQHDKTGGTCPGKVNTSSEGLCASKLLLLTMWTQKTELEQQKELHSSEVRGQENFCPDSVLLFLCHTPPPHLRVSSSTFCPLGCGAARRKCCGSDWQNITNIRREREPGRALPKSVLNSSFPRRLSLHMSD